MKTKLLKSPYPGKRFTNIATNPTMVLVTLASNENHNPSWKAIQRWAKLTGTVSTFKSNEFLYGKITDLVQANL